MFYWDPCKLDALKYITIYEAKYTLQASFREFLVPTSWQF